MKIAIDLESQYTENPVAKALQLIGDGFCLTFGSIAESSVIISDTPDKCLQYLKQDKQVIQFIYGHRVPAEGLLECTRIASRSSICFSPRKTGTH